MTSSRLALLVPALCLAGCFSPVGEVLCGPDLPCADGSACVGGECKGSGGTGGSTGTGGSVGTGGSMGTGGGPGTGGSTGTDGGTACGCVDASGACQPGTQTWACGASGGSCQSCPTSDACLNGACTPSGCTPTTCPTGCCTAFGTCVSSPSSSACGLAGQQCVSCSSGDVCRMGQCQSPPGGGSPGSACTVDSDCRGTMGAPPRCKRVTSSGNASYPGGFCTIDCLNATCPRGSQCLTMPAYGETDHFCAPDCAPFLAPCRTPGYACYTSGGGSGGGVCWLSPLPGGPDAGVSLTIGAACTFDAQCGTAPSFCFAQRQPPPIGDTGYLGGACAQPCQGSTLACPTGSACVTETFGGMFGAPSVSLSNCRQTCAVPGSGQSICRAGYVCAQIPNVSRILGFCAPSCLNAGVRCPSGTTCRSSGICQ